MNKTYAAALDYILEKAVEKKNGVVGGISTEQSAMGQTVYLASTFQKANIKGVIDKYLEKEYKVDSYEIAEMYKKLENDGYIREDKDKQIIKITLKGMDFISHEIGGFTKERINKIKESTHRVRFDNVLAWGTVGLVVVEFLIHYPKILKNIYHLLCRC